MSLAIKLKVYDLPTSYIGKEWANIPLPQPEKDRLSNIFKGALPTATLFVQGTAAPIVNQLFEANTKVRGIDLSYRLADPFALHINPKADVLVVYNVDNPVGNAKVVKKVMEDIINYARQTSSLVIIESNATSSEFEGNYGIKLVNKIKIPDVQEVKFV